VRAPAKGFTLVELLVGGAVATIGMYASLTLAVAALQGNSERRDAMLAEGFAEHLIASVQADATMWTGQDPNAPPVTPLYLKKLPGFARDFTTGWMPAPGNPFSNDRRVGALGADTSFYDTGVLYEVQKDKGQRYCAWVRLQWVTPELVRAEARVAWARPRTEADKYAQCPLEMVDDVGGVGSVTLPGMVMKNTVVQ
jgi:type II secretory pathway pseudopilin PulG